MMYIGPGAGFAFLGSFLALLGGVLLGLASLLLWPFRMAIRAVRGQQGYKNAKIRKLIFLGLDGLDPALAERYMAEGKLPNFAKLRQEGAYGRLVSAKPLLSPVVWTTIATGKTPEEHHIGHFVAVNR
jgi:predicted AlkP superfamily pyrophosphatase or phosphodiesterase